MSAFEHAARVHALAHRDTLRVGQIAGLKVLAASTLLPGHGSFTRTQGAFGLAPGY